MEEFLAVDQELPLVWRSAYEMWESCFGLGAADVEGTQKESTGRIGGVGEMPGGVRHEELYLFNLYERGVRNALITLHNRENGRCERAF